MADDADRLAGVQLQRHAVQHRDVAVGGTEARDVEHDVARDAHVGVVDRRGDRRTRCAHGLLAHLARLPM